MCGIIGISYGPAGPAGEDWTPNEMAEIMFPAIIHRGPHAWGYMYCPSTADSIEYFKAEGRCDRAEALKQIEIPTDVKWWVGHVRYATHGSPKNLANNHPIHHGDIVGVHNGVLKNWRGVIEETGRSDESAEVDSEAIFAAINKWGMRGGLTRINGDMVSVFAKTDHPEILRIARSYGRPLVYATTESGSLIFASECCVLEATGMKMGEPIELVGKYRLLTVKDGRITERAQYRSDSWKKYEGGVRGMTDFFDSGRRDSLAAPPREVEGGGGIRLVTPAPTPRRPMPNPQRRGGPARSVKPDRYGGVHIGNGVYRTPDGRIMNVEQYVDWSVEQALKMVRSETPTADERESVQDAAVRMAAADQAAADEHDQQIIIDYNNRGGRA
jgi:hypothetical protein